MSNSKLALTISPTLTDHPHANLVPWKLAINRAARGVFAEWDAYGFLFAVCDNALWALLNTPPGGQLRAKPDFPEPAALAAGANPAARDAFKRATESRAALLACAASFLLAILDSIGEANSLAISDPLTDTLHLTPRGVIIEMTALHGVMTGAEVDALRLPLKKKLSAVSDLPSHIVTFRGVLARLANAGQALYRSMCTVCSSPPSPHSPFSSSIHYCLLWRTGQLRNRRSRLMPRISSRNCITS